MPKKSISITEEQSKKLEKIKKEIGVPISTSIQKALELYFKKRK